MKTDHYFFGYCTTKKLSCCQVCFFTFFANYQPRSSVKTIATEQCAPRQLLQKKGLLCAILFWIVIFVFCNGTELVLPKSHGSLTVPECGVGDRYA
ncbi:hypothetical protein CDAR_612391 [Caerostris darwini]|uniref:Uncharacterized protein n=1 Tax=Caerostris darwini TaxID=1538125 RepID=A0AAV4SF63_9ARAC|nr:hypothetical protein CDAR_612391 [Caerostris darwini]